MPKGNEKVKKGKASTKMLRVKKENIQLYMHQATSIIIIFASFHEYKKGCPVTYGNKAL